MKLLALTTTNFMPYKGLMTITFPSDLERNVMLVYGNNMRGKTSLLNALRWAFYGKAMGRHSRELPLNDLVNREAALEGDWSMESCVTFEAYGNFYEYRRRAIKGRLISKPSRPEDFDVTRALKCNGAVLGDHLIDAEINKIAPEQTSRFFLFDGELLQEYEELLIDDSDQGRKIKDSIEQALGVPTLIRGREDAQNLLKNAQKQQSKDLEKISGMERHVDRQKALQAEVEMIEGDLSDLSGQLNRIKTERIKLDDFIESTEQVHVAKVRLMSIEDNLQKNAQRQKTLESERLGLIRDVWRDLIRSQITTKRDQLMEENNFLSDAMIQQAKVKGKIEYLHMSFGNATCHSCGQAIHSGQREKAKNELSDLEAKLKEISVDENRRSLISAEIRDLDRILKPGPIPLIASCDLEISRLKVEETKLDNETEKLRDQIKGQDTLEIARKRTLRDGLIKEEGRIDQHIRTNQSKMDKANNDLAMISKALESIPTARAARSSRVVKIASELEQIYGRSIDKLREALKARVEGLASDAFKSMTTQGKYSGLKINNNYGLAILDERGCEVPVRSAGAEQIVALSLIDGLSRAGKSAGPIIMDTPFGRLDPGHRAKILKYLPTTTQQLILFVHEGEVNRDRDLDVISSRVGCVYEINEVSPLHSKIDKVAR